MCSGDENIYHVKMTATDDSQKDIYTYTEVSQGLMKKTNPCFAFGRFLFGMGYHGKAKIYFQALLGTECTESCFDLAHRSGCFCRVARENRLFDEALEIHRKALRVRISEMNDSFFFISTDLQ